MALFQIFQILELPSETDRLETHQVLNLIFNLIFSFSHFGKLLIHFSVRHILSYFQNILQSYFQFQALLITKRELFLQAVTNTTESALYR